MNARRHGLIKVLALGVAVLILVSAGLFWARCLCGTLRHQVLFVAREPLTIRPSGLLPGEVESDPNVGFLSVVQAGTSERDPLLAGLGMAQYVQAYRPGGSRSDVYRWSLRPDESWVYFDRSLGLIVYRDTKVSRRRDGTTAVQYVTLYAGPEGMSTTPDEELGRFIDPLVDGVMGQLSLVYDRALRRFFVIKTWQRGVTGGPQLPVGDAYQPVQIGWLRKNPLSLDLSILFRSPQPISTDDSSDRAEVQRSWPLATWDLPFLNNTAFVLDASGRIDRLDLDTLQLGPAVARLPRPATVFSWPAVVTPRDVAAYAVQSVVLTPDGAGRDKLSYAGCAVAALSGDATAVRVEVFDPNGRVVASDETRYAVSAKTPAQSPPVAATVVNGLQFALENLHPPALLLLSYLTAPHFEATAGYRSLLLLPGSLVAMKARDTRVGHLARVSTAEVLMLPAVFLAVLLAGLVARDAVRIGLAKNARAGWIVGTLVLGLPAYITYRLSRPVIRMVTCQNCGRMRRPDQEKCHHCGSAWVVPELTPPAWRVLDNEGEEEDPVSASARAADSSAP